MTIEFYLFESIMQRDSISRKILLFLDTYKSLLSHRLFYEGLSLRFVCIIKTISRWLHLLIGLVRYLDTTFQHRFGAGLKRLHWLSFHLNIGNVDRFDILDILHGR